MLAGSSNKFELIAFIIENKNKNTFLMKQKKNISFDFETISVFVKKYMNNTEKCLNRKTFLSDWVTYDSIKVYVCIS